MNRSVINRKSGVLCSVCCLDQKKIVQGTLEARETTSWKRYLSLKKPTTAAASLVINQQDEKVLFFPEGQKANAKKLVRYQIFFLYYYFCDGVTGLIEGREGRST
jgi:hypothetical protein